MENSTFYRWAVLYIWNMILFFVLLGCGQNSKTNTTETDEMVVINRPNYTIEIKKKGFRYGFKQPDGEVIAGAHSNSGIQIGREGTTPSPIRSASLVDQEENRLVFKTETESGITATINLWTHPHHVKMAIEPEEADNYTILGRTSRPGPAYGLGDHGAFDDGSWDHGVRPKTELTGFEMDPMRGHRMISNFVIFPQNDFATVNIEPADKIVRSTEEESVQGSKNVRSIPALYYFMGNSKEIYQSFLKVRNEEGYPVYRPKYEWFGVGWEAFGALSWKTTHKTVKNNIDQYLNNGYPLEWMVIGSGFWPRGEKEFDEHGTPYGAEEQSEESQKLLATTSFGMWDEVLYPDPEGMIKYFHEQGLIFTIGLRNAFIPGGPFTDEGLENGYLIKDEEGNARLFTPGFPRSEVYFLDAYNPEAVDWYVELCQKWMDFGVDGFKEDIFGYDQSLPDDLVDPINRALMDQGVYIMGRNNYLGSPADIHRYNDFNYNQPQDRGPINGLAYAYSGFPYVYPDIVGGTGLATGRFGDEPKEKLKTYLIRYAEYAALNPSMSFGYGPWNFDEETTEITLQAAKLHDRLQPFIYSNAIKAYKTGFPWTLTPLPLAYPEDPNVYGLADTTRRSYQWMIGESLLATPLYGDDYATANSRDVYLPEGTWIEYDSGQKHEGPTTLDNYPLPIGKTPLFIGGTGVVVEEVDGELKGRLYPVTAQAEMNFYDKDGETRSTIIISEPDWKVPVVTDQTTGETVTGNWNRHAYEFALIPGHDYRVE